MSAAVSAAVSASALDLGAAIAGPRAAATDSLAPALAALAAILRRSTVEVRTGGSGVGSGVVWHAAGLIVTNAHVARADALTVIAPDGHALDGRVVARDRRRDLAAVVVPTAAARDGALTPAATGNPSELRPGDLLLALGHPLGITGAVALGVVHVVEPGRAGAPRWIRADIRLAPGNSGGPLADACGRVVGINTMIAAGLGIAVPVTTIERFLTEAGIRTRPGETRAA